MRATLEDLILKTRTLPPISRETAHFYAKESPRLHQAVQERIDASLSLAMEIEAVQTLREHHRHHAEFMGAVLHTGNHEMLARHLPWMYRVLTSRGVPPDSFPEFFQAWIRAVEQHLPPTPQQELLQIYEWILDTHELVTHLALSDPPPPLSGKEPSVSRRELFQECALQGDHHGCLGLAIHIMEKAGGVVRLYMDIIQPVMQRVGELWERGELSVAEEHLVSHVVNRVVTQVSLMEYPHPPARGTALVTTAPREAHELGAWMVADLLEHDGWDVRYLGADTPKSDVVRMAADLHPEVLALSIGLPGNLPRAAEVIHTLKTNPATQQVHIMVGGHAFADQPELWKHTGADAFAPNAMEARELARAWDRHVAA